MDFDALYTTRCAGCHGTDGKLGPAPPLNDPIFLAIVPDEELLRVITEGRTVTPGQKSPMPAFARDRGGPLTAQQVQAVTQGIKARWGGARPKVELPPYLAPKEAGDKDRGGKIFSLACAACHGDMGLGAEQAGALNDRAFLALISDQALRRVIITGRRDLGMPDYSDPNWRSPEFNSLTSADINDLVALLKDWRQGRSSNGQ
jgi:mono/diheme cytochrome c family protein